MHRKTSFVRCPKKGRKKKSALFISSCRWETQQLFPSRQSDSLGVHLAALLAISTCLRSMRSSMSTCWARSHARQISDINPVEAIFQSDVAVWTAVCPQLGQKEVVFGAADDFADHVDVHSILLLRQDSRWSTHSSYRDIFIWTRQRRTLLLVEVSWCWRPGSLFRLFYDKTPLSLFSHFWVHPLVFWLLLIAVWWQHLLSFTCLIAEDKKKELARRDMRLATC